MSDSKVSEVSEESGASEGSEVPARTKTLASLQSM